LDSRTPRVTRQLSTSYDPFGGTTTTGSSSTNTFQYTGRENDGNGLYYYRARYYSPQFGRFISEDPIGFVAGLNFYSYVGDDPVNQADPFGLKEFPNNFIGPLSATCYRSSEMTCKSKRGSFVFFFLSRSFRFSSGREAPRSDLPAAAKSVAVVHRTHSPAFGRTRSCPVPAAVEKADLLASCPPDSVRSRPRSLLPVDLETGPARTDLARLPEWP
jgi:RHS repeat-associated protein